MKKGNQLDIQFSAKPLAKPLACWNHERTKKRILKKYYMRMCNLLYNAFCNLINIPHVAIGTLLSVVCGYACIKDSYDHYNVWCISMFYVTLRLACALISCFITTRSLTDEPNWTAKRTIYMALLVLGNFLSVFMCICINMFLYSNICIGLGWRLS